MAKKSSAAANSIKKILESTPPLTHAELQTALLTFFHTSDGLPNPWDESKRSMSRCPTLVGDAGCGKTTAIRNLCKKLDFELRFMPTGAALDEDGLGIPEQLEQSSRDRLEHEMWMSAHPKANPKESPVFRRLQKLFGWSDDDTKHALEKKVKTVSEEEFRNNEIGGKGMAESFRVKPPAWAPVEPPKGRGGILFIDEIFTASEMQQNMISLAITQYGYAGINFHPGWWLVGASNPPTDAYYLSKEPDARMLARLWLLPVKPSIDDTLRYFQDNKVMSDRLYGFLLMNKNFVSAVDGRTWEDVGHFEKQNSECGIMPFSVFRTVLAYRLGNDIVNAYEAYARYGNDPYYYPITATNMLNASAEEHKSQVEIFERWVKDNKQAHIGASIHDLIKYLSDKDFRLSDKQAQNIGKIMSVIPNADLLANVFEHIQEGPNAALMAKYIRNSPVAKKLAEMYMLDRADDPEQAFRKIK